MQHNLFFGDSAENFGLVGDSPPIQHVLRTIHKLRNDCSPVLITGESGVGKELVARAIHRVSPLAENRFLAVDSASLVGSLMESELFGHLKGAFTGATESKLGLVRAADGGTLFLDEIGELPPEVQAKLLRVLQEGEMRPIGSTKPLKVTVRIVAATNRDLVADIQSRAFRKDLYYRLNVISIQVPPLRDRRGDIPTLARHFIQKHAVRRVVLSDEVLDALKDYDWPGNVRELENVIRRMVALKSNPIVLVEDLPASLQDFAGAAPASDDYGEIAPLAEVERQHILRAVEFTKGDMNAAALMLGIGRTTLYRKMKAYRRQRREMHAIPRETSAPSLYA